MSTVIDKERAKRNLAYHVVKRLGELGKTRYWLAQQMGTSESQIQNIVEQRSVPNWAFVCNLAEVLDVPLDSFQEDPPTISRKKKIST